MKKQKSKNKAAVAADDPFNSDADAVPDQHAFAQAFAELDRLTLLAERATEARTRAEERLQQYKIKPSLPGYERVGARMEALRWLVDHGHGQDARVGHGHSQDARVDEPVVEPLRGWPRGLVLHRGVESSRPRKDIQTLGALVRELLADGKVVPRDLGAFFNLLTYGEREAGADGREQEE